MDENRIIRMSVAGWAVILSCLLHLWIFGVFTFQSVAVTLQQPYLTTAVVSAIGAVAAGPLLGFVISSLGAYLVGLTRGGHPDFDLPGAPPQPILKALGDRIRRRYTTVSPDKNDPELKEFGEALAELQPTPELKKEVEDRYQAAIERSCATRKGEHKGLSAKESFDKLLPYFNVLYHSRAPNSLIAHTTRRWTMYWMHVSTVIAMVVGAAFALAMKVRLGSTGIDWWRAALLVAVWAPPFFVSRKAQRDARGQVNSTCRLWLKMEAAAHPSTVRSRSSGGRLP
jgi:ABC-type sugar transport system permease subunit